MKTSTKNLPAEIKPETMEAATAITVRACEIEFPEGVETLGEKANFLHSYSVEASKRSTGAAILAGWVLSVARSTCAYGQWNAWLKNNVSFSESTARNYLSLYAQTLGAQRAAMRRPIALDVQPTEDELEAAAHDVDGKSLSALYKSTRLIKASDNWGGAGRGQGRKPKGDAEVAAELKAIAKNEAVIWASAKGSLDNLVLLNAKRDVFHRLSDEHLATVSGLLADLAGAAAKALEKRLGAAGDGTPALPTTGGGRWNARPTN